MSFNQDKHVKYWRMCARGLPGAYTGNDSSRMSLGFFTVAALDLLGALDTIDVEERNGWISWIYSCQVPEGGFRGFTGSDLQDARSSLNNHWDPANLPATFFALAALLILGDDLAQVKRLECLAWLPKLQRPDGSFGEVLSMNETIEGGRDLRQCYCAAGIAYILKNGERSQPVFDEQQLMHYIQACQSPDGGFGVSPLREPHSGLSYCAVGALSILQRLNGDHSQDILEDLPCPERAIKWFLERQTNIVESDSDIEDDDDGNDKEIDNDEQDPIAEQDRCIRYDVAGFNGRDGKIADTCYCWWNAGALAMLHREFLIDSNSMVKYLLETTQHRIGGFGKGCGDTPDVLHSYLGLAAIALFGQPGLKTLDPTMSMSVDAVARLEHVAWRTVS